MKIKLSGFCAALFMVCNSFSNVNNGNLTINYKATGTLEGYSYISKMVVFIDDIQFGESPAMDQQQNNTFILSVPEGKHKIKCVVWAKIEDKWEERLKANDYSFDWVYREESLQVEKETNLTIEFDITNDKVIKR
jgi:hypothetical protein